MRQKFDCVKSYRIWYLAQSLGINRMPHLSRTSSLSNYRYDEAIIRLSLIYCSSFLTDALRLFIQAKILYKVLTKIHSFSNTHNQLSVRYFAKTDKLGFAKNLQSETVTVHL